MLTVGFITLQLSIWDCIGRYIMFTVVCLVTSIVYTEMQVIPELINRDCCKSALISVTNCCTQFSSPNYIVVDIVDK